MSEIKTLDVEVDFPDRLDVDVDFGQTLTKFVAPEHYMGPFEFYPSDKDQVIPVKEKTPVEDICVKGITGEKTITQNGTYNTLEDKTVVVDVPQRFTLQTIADRSALQNLGEITIRVPELKSYMLGGWSFETVHLPETTRINDGIGVFPIGVKYIDIPNVTNIGNIMYGHRDFLGTYGDGDGIVKLKSVTYIGGSSFYQCKLIQKVYIYRNLTIFDRSTFRGCSNLTDVYVPWSEGAIANAPWEANNATIHYDTVYDEDGNVVSST